MRKVVFQMLTTLNGFFEGPNRNIDWHHTDGEFNEYAIENLKSVETLVFGRVTYELMASYWPTPAALNDDPVVAERMNSIEKIVFSRTLRSADWNNTRIVKTNPAMELDTIKRGPGGDIDIFGSSDLAVSLLPKKVIDEFRIMINPIVIGGGTPLFAGIDGTYKFRLLNAKVFKSGNVMLFYEPEKGEQ